MGLPALKSEPKPSRIVLVTANKGGTGKTTTAVNLACAAAADGYNACGIDFDTQHSFARWAERRKRYKPTLEQIRVVQGRLEFFPSMITQVADADVVFIDTPPAVPEIADLIHELVKLADLVIVPTKTGFFDVEAVVAWKTTIQVTQSNVTFLMNMVNDRSIGFREARTTLAMRGDVCAFPIPALASIERTICQGGSAADSKTVKGGVEYQALWEWVKRGVEL